jgi:hypothetical protein
MVTIRTKCVTAFGIRTTSARAFSFQTQSVKAYVYQMQSVKVFALWYYRIHLPDNVCQFTCRSQLDAAPRMRTR